MKLQQSLHSSPARTLIITLGKELLLYDLKEKGQLVTIK